MAVVAAREVSVAPAVDVTEPKEFGFSKTRRGTAAIVATATTTTLHLSMVVSASRAPSLSPLIAFFFKCYSRTKIYEELREKTNDNKSTRESDHFERESCPLLVHFTKPVKFFCILSGCCGYFFFSEAFNLSYKSTCVNYVCWFICLASKWDWSEIWRISFYE